MVLNVFIHYVAMISYFQRTQLMTDNQMLNWSASPGRAAETKTAWPLCRVSDPPVGDPSLLNRVTQHGARFITWPFSRLHLLFTLLLYLFVPPPETWVTKSTLNCDGRGWWRIENKILARFQGALSFEEVFVQECLARSNLCKDRQG